MIWKNSYDIDFLNKTMDNTLVSHLGIKIIEVGDDHIKATMPVDNRTKQPMGLLHGGASAAMSESIGSIAGMLLIKDPTKESIVGIDISANHLRSATGGEVYSITKPIKVGRRIQLWNTEIFDEQDRLICVSKLTTMIIQHK